MPRCITHLTALASFALIAFGMVGRAAARPQLRDYLSDEEADKIRDADTPALRIKLYMSFADDRLKKFDYELKRTAPERGRFEILNGLLNGYEGCMDDASNEIDDAKLKQTDIHEALKLMDAKGKMFLVQLRAYEKHGRDLVSYRDTLEDAIDSTNDALSDVASAEKRMLPAPIRRKP
jgi:hypothetical protein